MDGAQCGANGRCAMHRLAGITKQNLFHLEKLIRAALVREVTTEVTQDPVIKDLHDK